MRQYSCRIATVMVISAFVALHNSSGAHGVTLNGSGGDAHEVPTWRVSFDWESSFELGSRTVTFDASQSVVPADAAIKWSFGDGTSTTRSGVGPFSRRYARSGEYVVSAKLICPDCGPSSDRQRIVTDPITAYSPEVHLAPGETRLPATPSWFASHSTLKWNHDDGCPDHVWSGRPNLAKLGGKFAAPYSHYVTTSLATLCRGGDDMFESDEVTRPYQDGPPNKAPELRNQNRPEGFYLDLDNSARSGQSADVAMSFNAEPGGYITYWLFYAYDPKVNIGVGRITAHEGDWERVTVRLDDDNRAVAVDYFQHRCPAERVRWSALNDKTDGTHPPVYSAKGSHASYPAPIRVGYVPGHGSCSLRLDGLGDVAGNGTKVWSPWQRGGLIDASRQSWYGFGGAWGEVTAPAGTGWLDAASTTGPLGPPYKDTGTVEFD